MRYIYAIVGGFLGILLCVGFGITDKNVAMIIVAIMSAGAMAGGD
jgi:hypothetical protein